MWKVAILSKEAWTKMLQNFELRRRRDKPVIYLHDKWDVTNDRKLVIKIKYDG